MIQTVPLDLPKIPDGYELKRGEFGSYATGPIKILRQGKWIDCKTTTSVSCPQEGELYLRPIAPPERPNTPEFEGFRLVGFADVAINYLNFREYYVLSTDDDSSIIIELASIWTADQIDGYCLANGPLYKKVNP